MDNQGYIGVKFLKLLGQENLVIENKKTLHLGYFCFLIKLRIMEAQIVKIKDEVT